MGTTRGGGLLGMSREESLVLGMLRMSLQVRPPHSLTERLRGVVTRGCGAAEGSPGERPPAAGPRSMLHALNRGAEEGNASTGAVIGL